MNEYIFRKEVKVDEYIRVEPDGGGIFVNADCAELTKAEAVKLACAILNHCKAKPLPRFSGNCWQPAPTKGKRLPAPSKK